MSRLGIFGSKEKLKSILQNIVIKYYGVNEALTEVLSWHKSERKKWALGLVGKDKEYISLENMEGRHNIDGYNEAKAEIRKKIEESEC